MKKRHLRELLLPLTVERKVQETNYFCPACGKQDVWADITPGDGSHSGRYGCIGCHETFAMDTWIENGPDTRRIVEEMALAK